MKRQLFVLTFSLLAVSIPDCLYAQSGIRTNGIAPSQIAYNPAGIIRAHNSWPQTHSANKTTTGNASRLIKITTWLAGSTSTSRDSVLFDYSAGRGGYCKLGSGYAIDGRGVKYDNMHQYVYDMPSGTYNPYNKSFQVFDANNNITMNTEQEWVTSSGTWQDLYQQQNTYDALNNKLTTVDLGANLYTGLLENTGKTINTYTGHYVVSEVHQQWTQALGIWENYTKSTYAYDGMNNVVGTQLKLWDSATAAWKDYSREIYSYDGANNRISWYSQNWNDLASTWEDIIRELYIYDGSGNKVTDSSQLWDQTSGTWINLSRVSLSGFTAHQPGQLISQQWDQTTSSFTNIFRNSYTYNGFNQITFFGQEPWDNSAGAWHNQMGQNFYYESYVSGVAAVANTNGKAVIYPVPASGSVTVDVTWDQPQAFILSVVNVLGKTIETRNIAACSHFSEMLSIGDLPSGNYLVKMEGVNGRIVQEITIAR